MARVEVAPRAAADADTILIDLHGQGGRRAAESLQLRLKEANRLIADHPEIGRRRPDIGPGVRAVVVRPYLVVRRYHRTRDTVFVLRVLHGRRRLTLDAP